MQNLHDDNHLDELSRQAAEQFEPEQGLHSWDTLRPQLEAALPQKKERKRRFFLILFLFLLVGGGLIFSAIWTQNRPSNKELVDTKPNAGNPTAPAENKSATPANNNPAIPGNNTSPGNSVATTPANNTDHATTSSGEPVKIAPAPVASPPAEKTPVQKAKEPQQTNAGSTSLAATNSTSENDRRNQKVVPPATSTKKEYPRQKNPKVASGNKSTNDKQDKLASANSTSTSNEPETQKAIKKQAEKPVADQSTAQTSTEEKSTTLPPAAEKPVVDEPKTDSAITLTPALEKNAATTQQKTKTNQSSPNKNRWEFALVYAPDISTIRFTHTQKPGMNLGVMVGYNISKRFSIQAGALYTSKNYKAHGDDYHPPKGYWTDYVDLETVTASCNMWDIPVNLRYNLVPRSSSNWFATAGLSSYLMQKEDYDFYYYYNGNPTSRYRSFDSDSKHWFAVLNLSFGYERQVSKRISLQAEPFFKQPLGGVGFGNVRLNTSGIYFSIKYKPVPAAGKPAKRLK